METSGDGRQTTRHYAMATKMYMVTLSVKNLLKMITKVGFWQPNRCQVVCNRVKYILVVRYRSEFPRERGLTGQTCFKSASVLKVEESGVIM